MRALVLMATARQRAEWVRVAALVCWIGPAVWAQKAIKAEQVIPKQFQAPQEEAPERTPEEKAAESKRGWRVMDWFFGGKKLKAKKGSTPNT